ncbi:hypothetical protein [Streptomyces iconiensis]|uniref:Uncharacterized protein n=1 Tax=Streptomyces iconiensis TaxID=1384038 RepID=A0ABT7A1A3_9ACTN|nr:hypothetical protein [Streptomyces iconiensis]MDJ1135097.1 hypothetical protein [Streptomyces iconiensis]
MCRPERCLDDCVTLVHAYADFGLAAEVRSAEARTAGPTTEL